MVSINLLRRLRRNFTPPPPSSRCGCSTAETPRMETCTLLLPVTCRLCFSPSSRRVSFTLPALRRVAVKHDEEAFNSLLGFPSLLLHPAPLPSGASAPHHIASKVTTRPHSAHSLRWHPLVPSSVGSPKTCSCGACSERENSSIPMGRTVHRLANSYRYQNELMRLNRSAS